MVPMKISKPSLALAFLYCAHAQGAHARDFGPFGEDGEAVVAEFHAEGAQIYECGMDSTGASLWQFREPIATLLLNDKTVGRHYAGPSWELADGSFIEGTLADHKPGKTTTDIPLLKFDAIDNSRQGKLATVTTVLRLDTIGGVLDGVCDEPGTFKAVSYSARYVFLTKG